MQKIIVFLEDQNPIPLPSPLLKFNRQPLVDATAVLKTQHAVGMESTTGSATLQEGLQTLCYFLLSAFTLMHVPLPESWSFCLPAQPPPALLL